MKLNPSGIIFNAEEHTYTTEDGRQLSGITSLLSARLHPDKFAGVDEAVLAAATERGSIVHGLCQFEDEKHTTAQHDNEEYVRASNTYSILRSKRKCKPIANEYTVTDGFKYASNVDGVWASNPDGTEVTLADIKCTYNLDVEYVTWQLSIYAMLFEAQNPHLKVKDIVAVWLPFRNSLFADNLAKTVKLKRKSVEEVTSFLYDELTEQEPAEIPALVSDDEIAEYIQACNIIAEAELVKKQFEENLKEKMQTYPNKSWEMGNFRATYTQEGTRRSFDSKTFAKDNPDMYDKYMKETATKPRLTITFK